MILEKYLLHSIFSQYLCVFSVQDSTTSQNYYILLLRLFIEPIEVTHYYHTATILENFSAWTIKLCNYTLSRSDNNILRKPLTVWEETQGQG